MIFERRYAPRFTDTDQHGRVSPVTIYNYMQDAAIGHGEDVGVSPLSLRDRGFAWILSRIRIEFLAYPARTDEIIVRTWGSNMKGLYAVREWRLTDGQGIELARATSRWVLFDTQKTRVVRLPEFIPDEYGVHPDRALDYSFERTTPTDSSEVQRHFHVRASDLDTNRHANSSCYVDWCIEAVPDDLLMSSRPSLIDISYKKESLFGDEIVASGSPIDSASNANHYQHAIHRGVDGPLLAFGESAWAPIA